VFRSVAKPSKRQSKTQNFADTIEAKAVNAVKSNRSQQKRSQERTELLFSQASNLARIGLSAGEMAHTIWSR
jgi:hypothetical protein